MKSGFQKAVLKAFKDTSVSTEAYLSWGFDSMPAERAKRKLTAILSGDALGYSRLMGEDELGTAETLKAYREAMTARIEQHRGRLVDATGDNMARSPNPNAALPVLGSFLEAEPRSSGCN